MLEPTIDPLEVGVDASRLARIDALTHSYVDSGRFPCSQFLLARGGEIVHHDVYGFADVDSQRPLRDDSIFRVYSMTKPVTSVGLMMLYEQGRVLLEDPVSKYLPAFADVRVYVSGDHTNAVTREPARAMTVKDVLTHTSGLTYGFQHQHAVDAMYRDVGLGDFGVVDYDLTECMARLATKPLLFDPGAGWNYSMSTDVCGAIIEAISGQTLDVYLKEHIFDPLGMVDTAFWVDGEDRADRLTTNYVYLMGDKHVMDPWETSAYKQPAKFLSGGGGLVSTMADYHKFAQCLLDGGHLAAGGMLIGSRTIEFMTNNHLPGGRLLNDMGQASFSEAVMDGLGFGLGFSVNTNPAINGGIGSVGDYGWGGAASTVFHIDPDEDLLFIFMTQLVPSSVYPIRRELRATVYQSLL